MWVTKLLVSPVKIRILAQKMTKFGLKLAFLVILGQALPAHLVRCWWIGWWLWRAGCISQDTNLLYAYSCISFNVIQTLKGPPSHLHICLHPRTWPGALGSYRRTVPCPRQVVFVAINIIITMITINREHQLNIMMKV